MRYIPLLLLGFLLVNAQKVGSTPLARPSDSYYAPRAEQSQFDPTQQYLHNFALLNHTLYKIFSDPQFTGGREQFVTDLYRFPHIGEVRLVVVHPLDSAIGLEHLTKHHTTPARSDELTVMVRDVQGNDIVCQDTGIDGYGKNSIDIFTLPADIPAAQSPQKAAALCTYLSARIAQTLRQQEIEKTQI